MPCAPMKTLAALRPSSPFAVLLLILLIGTVYRGLALHWAGLNLYVDEAQYWTWAQALDWGYYSKPPVIAALIAATTSLFGDGEFAIKLGSLLLYPLSTLLVYALAQRLYDRRIAFWSALSFFTLPGVALSSMIISTDVALFLCWASATYAFVRATETNAWRWWLAVGLSCGIGLMSKYTMGIFAVSALLHVGVTPQLRHHFANPRPYAAAALAALIFAPNLWWNAQNGWPTFQHTAEISNLEGGAGLHWDELAEFLSGQAAILGPLLFLAFIALLLRPWWRQPAERLLACYTLPFLGIICLQALLGRANANWGAMAYVAGTIWVVAFLLQGRARPLLVASLAFNLLLASLTYHYHALVRAADVPLAGSAKPIACWRAITGQDAQGHCPDFFKRVQGWDRLGIAVRERLQQRPNTLLLTDERDLISELRYYARPESDTAVMWNPTGRIDSHYALTTTLADKGGRDFLFVCRKATLPPELAARFAHVEAVEPIRIAVRPDWLIDLSVWQLQGYLAPQ